MEGQSSDNQKGRVSFLHKLRNLVFFISNFFKSFFLKLTRRDSREHFLRSLSNIVQECSKRSFISNEEEKMINNIIKIDDIKVSDIMIPRTDIIAISKNSNLDQIKDVIIDKEHTRIPVFGENLDDILGFIHGKDLVRFLSKDVIDFDINSLVRKIIYVPHSMLIVDLLRKMRYARVHIAIVLDEYGGTDGMITIEDIMEEIVGEIEDEHDLPDNNIYNKLQQVSDLVFEVGGRVEIEKVEDLINEKILDEELTDFETIGGLVLAKMKRVPEVGEVLELASDLKIKVLESDLKSIKLLRITKPLKVAQGQ